MSDLYFGKFSSHYPEQINEKFYAAGVEGGEWYGGIKPGDYVFPIYEGKISALWKVREYGEKGNKINRNDPGVVFFDLAKEYKEPVSLTNEFLKYKYFEHDLNLLNKSSKSVKNCGFHKITVSQNCPQPVDIEFKNNMRNIYIALEGTKITLNEMDILVKINNQEESKIIGIMIYKDNNLETYKTLQELYDFKNDNKYNLNELLNYAKQDNSPKKLKYLTSVLKDLQENGRFIIDNPIALYDNVLVGRKKSAPYKPSKKDATILGDDDEVQDELTEYEKYADLLNFNQNIILYGPPGTGKTYSTKKIVEAFDKMQNGGEFISFKEIEKQGRVKFITFHQAYSYEEFIEGIRPQIASEISDTTEENNQLKYNIEDGVLKQMANKASMQILKLDSDLKGIDKITDSSRIWKVSLGNRNKDEHIYKECKQNREIAIGWLENESLIDMNFDEIFKMLKAERDVDAPEPYNDAHSIDYFINEMNIGDVVLIYDGPKTIRDIGVIRGDYEFKEDKEYPRRRKVDWVKEYKKPVSIYEINGLTRLTLKAIYPLNKFGFTDIVNLINQDEGEESIQQNDKKAVPYYLIIDEINRGNVSKIFGELITLIEKDKRGNLSCILPYSKKPFTLPENLYIIGTMNTADRSIALLDTALRRRFSFIEIEPDMKIFNDADLIPSPKVNGIVDLAKLLGKLNEEIIVKLDRDHRIGHSYFMDIVNLNDLYNVWYYKIVPLLMEYFYGEIDTLRNLIGSSFFNSQGSINFLDTKSEDGQISDFENSLIKIYSKGN